MEQGKMTLKAHRVYEMIRQILLLTSFVCLLESDIGIKEILVLYLTARSVAMIILSRNAIWNEKVVT